MIRIFKHRIFDKSAKKEKISNKLLKSIISEISSGLYDAQLGKGIFKKRIGRVGEGKRSSYRSIIAFQSGKNAFFIYLFSKNEKDNITKAELESFRELADFLLNVNNTKLKELISIGSIKEIT